jgi:hypothetical protein
MVSMDDTPFHGASPDNRAGVTASTANWAVIRSDIEYPTMRLSKPPVFHRAEVKFALMGGMLRDVRQPQLVGASRCELTLHKIVSNSAAWRFS